MTKPTEKQIEELRDRLAKMPKFDRGIIWRYRDWGGTERLETFGETANALKYILDNTDAIVSALSAALAVEAGAEPNPMSFFSENVDRWGAAEWFNRLANAIREQDKACVAKDDIAFETYRMIAASSAMTLVRDHEAAVRSALTPASSAVGVKLEPVAWFVSFGINSAVFVLEASAREYAATKAEHNSTVTPLYALTPASSAVEGEAVAWRPIDTADKEAGRMLLGIVRNGNLEEVHIGFYSFAYNEDEVDCWWSEQGDDEIVPTHWAPLFLPASPAPQTEDRADG